MMIGMSFQKVLFTQILPRSEWEYIHGLLCDYKVTGCMAQDALVGNKSHDQT